MRVESFYSSRKLRMADEMKNGPFISCYGISMYDPSYEYGARLNRILSLISKATSTKLTMAEFTDSTDTTSKGATPCNSGDNNEVPGKDLSKLIETTNVSSYTRITKNL